MATKAIYIEAPALMEGGGNQSETFADCHNSNSNSKLNDSH